MDHHKMFYDMFGWSFLIRYCGYSKRWFEILFDMWFIFIYVKNILRSWIFENPSRDCFYHYCLLKTQSEKIKADQMCQTLPDNSPH